MTATTLAAPAAALTLLPLAGLLAEAAFLKASFYAEQYGKGAMYRQQSALVQKSTTYTPQKSTTYTADNRPANHRGVRKEGLAVNGLVSAVELEKLLSRKGWACWSTSVRVNALVLLVADAADRVEEGVFDFSRDRARLLCSWLPAKIASAHGAPSDGLAVLEALDVFKLKQAGRRYPFARAAEYCFGDRFASRSRFRVRLNVTPAQATRWHDRSNRIRDRFEQSNPIVAVVRETAARMELSAQGYEELLRLRTTAPNHFPCAESCRKWLEAPHGEITRDNTHTIHSPISRCSKLIRPYLLMDQQDVVEIDISNAHPVMLTRIYEPEFLSIYRIPHTPEEAEQERLSLVAQIEAGDVYGGGTKEEREERKKRTLAGLNRRAVVQIAMSAAEPLLAGRRILTEAMWRVKKTDHRNLGQWLRRWTGDIVNPAVMALHSEGIPSIPIVDCLMVRRQDEDRARQELSSRIFEATGVRATVAGIRHTIATAS
jgi:hypothetical protein